MKTTKLWSNKGVALYPVDFPLVGQNAVFNALFKFKQAFMSSQGDDITGFFVVIGDWGLGKTRIGYELFAQTFNHVEGWLLNEDYIVPNGADGRLLKPQFAEGILPLYLRYALVCDDDLFADNWVARTTNAALRLVTQPAQSYQIPRLLLEDLRTALKARGVDLVALREALDAPTDDDARLEAALEVLRRAGIYYLWVVVDEVETLADLKKGMRAEDEPRSVSETYLDMIPTVIKHENYRQAHPYVNFLMLCSIGMRDKVEIGPNRRRTDSVDLEPNRIGDVRRYVTYLQERAENLGQSVTYPPGTLEGAFIASNRNFGWFNVMMSSIHESHRQALENQSPLTAWQLLEEFAQSEARAKWIFDLSVLSLLKGIQGAPKHAISRLVFGQLPVSLEDGFSAAEIKALQQVTVPGIAGPAFVDLVEVHLDERTLGDELTRPEIGFKISPQGGDRYLYYDSDISLSSLLAALRAFSVGAQSGNFVVCRDLNAFTAQLSALYDRPGVDVAQIAEPLHGIFLKYQETARRYLGPSFALLQQMDSLLKRETSVMTFLQDADKDARLTEYAEQHDRSDRKRWTAICQGFARLLDETINSNVGSVPSIRANAAITFKSAFQSPRFEGLQVTPEGQVTVVYGQDLEKLAQELGDWLGQTGVHPLVILLPAGMLETWHAQRLSPGVALCAIPRPLTRIEEDLLVKHSGKGTVFDAQSILSAKTAGLLTQMRQNWQRDTGEWRQQIERAGYLLRPLWYSKNIVAEDFALGYRLMLVKGWNIDQLAPDVNPDFETSKYDHVRKACQYNVDTPPGKLPQLNVITPEPYAPLLPPAFGALLKELKTQATPKTLLQRFFFAIPERDMKAEKQIGQILDLLCALGLVLQQRGLYRAVDGQTLKNYREATSAWLSGECQTLLTALADTFTVETVGKMQKRSTSYAPKDLAAVEQAAAQADFSSVFEQGGETPPEVIQALISQIQEIEARLQQICPAEIYQQTGVPPTPFTTERLAKIEEQLSRFSLWQEVRFYSWLRDQYRQRRDELANAVSQQLAEAQALKTAEGYPFPIAPLTQPLKAIQEEVLAAPTAGGRTSRNAIELPGYPHSVSTYLFMGDYTDAWERLEALGQYVERAQPDSFWARFHTARNQWARRVKDYQHAEAAWKSLSDFVQEAPSPAWQSARKTLGAELQQLRALVEGGLEETVNAELDRGAEKLLDALQEEIAAAAKYQGLVEQITALHEQVKQELRALIDVPRLQALGRVLTAQRHSQMPAPPLEKTYADTKAAYAVFNAKVIETGRSYFEGAGKSTLWDCWVEIYLALSENRYTLRPEDETALQELETLKLIERTVRLR